MNNYQLAYEIARGDRSVVYKGRRRETTEYYALSAIEKGRRAELMNAAGALRMLKHPNIVKLTDWYETGNHLWLILELCIGGDLRTVLSVEKKLSPIAVQTFGRDMANGLMYTHSRGVLNNDVKPSNLLMDASVTIRYYDFSICCYFPEAGERVIVGTPLYMAPELFLYGRGVSSTASDLWALGCVLYELASGNPPFPGEHLEDVVRAIMTAPTPVVREMSDSFNALIAALLTKDPVRRATWSTVTASPFWEGRLSVTVPTMPREPAFTAYQRRRGKAEWATPAEIDDAIKQAVEAARANSDEADFDEPPFDKHINFTPAAAVLSVYAPTPTATGVASEDTPASRRDGRRDSVSQTTAAVSESRSRPAAARRNSTAGKTGPVADAASTDIAGPRRRSVGQSKNAKPAMQYRSRSNGRRDADKDADTSALAAAGDDRYTLAQLQAFNKGALRSLGVEDVLWHQLDPHVRPLCGNARIEMMLKAPFNPKTLGFPAVTAEEINKWSEQEIVNYTVTPYRILSSPTVSLEQKYNIICYFYNIATEQPSANVLVNGAMLPLCLGFAGLKQASPVMKTTAIVLIGQLARHASSIHSESARNDSIGKMVALWEAESSTRVRRRLMATLGEFLFYIFMQQEPARLQWVCDPELLQKTFLSVLRGGDDIQKHYVTKTIENLTAAIDLSLARTAFCTPEFVDLMLGIGAARATPTCTETMRSAGICTAVKLAILNETLMPVMLRSDTFPISSYVAVLQSAPLPHTSQLLLTFLNFALVKALVTTGSDYTTMWNKYAKKTGRCADVFASSKLTTAEAEAILGDLGDMSDDILLGLSEAGDHSTPGTHGKTLLFVALINCLKASPLPRLCTAHIVGFLDRLLQMKDAYVVACGNVLCAVLSEFVSEKLSATVKRVSTATPILLNALQQLLSASTLRARLALPADVFTNLADCVEKCLSSTLYAAHEDAFNTVVECIATDGDLCARYTSSICPKLIGAYLQMLTRRQTHRRFTAVRILGLFVASLTADRKATPSRREAAPVNDTVAAIVDAVAPTLPTLLGDSAPVPSRTLHLLTLCGRARPTALSAIATTKTVDLLLDFLTSSRETDTQFGLEVMLLCMQQSGSARDELATYAVSKQLPALLTRVAATAVSEEIDDLQEAVCALTAFVLRKVVGEPSSRAATQCLALVENASVSDVYLPLSATCGLIGESAASVVNELCHLSSTAQNDLISESGLTALKDALKANRDSTSIPECTQAALEYLLKALRYACENCRKPDLQKLSQDSDLTVTIKSLTAAPLPRSVTTEASRLQRILRS